MTPLVRLGAIYGLFAALCFQLQHDSPFGLVLLGGSILAFIAAFVVGALKERPKP